MVYNPTTWVDNSPPAIDAANLNNIEQGIVAADAATRGAAGGDLSGNYPNPTLVATGPGATGPIGDATHAPVITIDAKGRVTALSSQALTASGSAGGDLTGTFPNPTVDLTKAHIWTANQTAPALVASGLTGATAASRYVGATASGAPVSGTFAVGDFVVDQSGKLWVCTAAGTPGTWGQVSGAIASVFGRTGTVTAQSGDYTAALVTNAADKSSSSQQAFTGELKSPDVVIGGLTGATAASRFVGATTSGAPVSGTFAVGDFIVDQSGSAWVCKTAGSPGTWGQISGGGGGLSPGGTQTATFEVVATTAAASVWNKPSIVDTWNVFTAGGTRVAVVDGTNHPLSEIYASLAAAQADFSFVTSTAQSRDWCAIQSCLYKANASVYISAGTWWCSDMLTLPSKNCHVWGAGPNVTTVKCNASGFQGGLSDINLSGKVFAYADGMRVIAPINNGWEGAIHIHDMTVQMLATSLVGAPIDIIGAGSTHINNVTLLGGMQGCIFDQCEIESLSHSSVEALSLPAGGIGGAGVWQVNGDDHLLATYTVAVNATAGTFTLTYGGQTTAAVAFNATPATLQSDLAALSTVGAGNASVFPSASSGVLPSTLNAGQVSVSLLPVATFLNGAITSGATSLVVSSAAGFPSTGSYMIRVGEENMLVTGGQGTTTWTVTRGQNGTSATAQVSGAQVSLELVIGTNSLTGGTASVGLQPVLGGFTNVIEINNIQFSPGVASPCVAVDGGFAVKIDTCNFNGGLSCVRAAGVQLLLVQNCESESQTTTGATFCSTNTSTVYGANGTGQVRQLTLIGNEIVGNGGGGQSGVDLGACTECVSMNNLYINGTGTAVTSVNGCANFVSILDVATGAGAYSTNNATNDARLVSGGIGMSVAGGPIKYKEGTNQWMGSVALTAGAATVSTTAVTANSRIYLTAQAPGGSPGWLRVSARTAGTSFTITSSSGTDTSTVAWMIIEPF